MSGRTCVFHFFPDADSWSRGVSMESGAGAYMYSTVHISKKEERDSKIPRLEFQQIILVMCYVILRDYLMSCQ